MFAQVPLPMLVAVMQIRQVNVTMQMLMLQGLVDVIVFMMFGQMQPDARNH